MIIGIYSGSFNPIHLGHVALCDYMVAQGIVDEVWLIRSPLNPLKVGTTLAPDSDRQAMLELAIAGHTGLRTCTIEDDLPRPNYTIQTLRALSEHYPDDEFHLIVGADNWLIFDRWRAWDTILEDYHLIVYPRPGSFLPEQPVIAGRHFATVRFVEAPLYDLSSTEVREHIAQGECPDGMIDPKVWNYIQQSGLYR